MITGLDHIGIAVHKIQDALPIYRQLLGLRLEQSKKAEDQGVRAALLTVGETCIELIEPLNAKSPISKFLEKRGQGIHHLAFRVDNLEEMLKHLKESGLTLIDETPRLGIEGGKIAFVHPKSTGDVLIELCER